MKRLAFAGLILALVALIGLVRAKPRHRVSLPPTIALSPAELTADGYDSATLTIFDSTGTRPRIAIDPPHSVGILDVNATDRGWQAQLRAGTTPAAATIRVDLGSGPAAVVRLVTTLDPIDTAADGTPDFLRLDDPADQRAFRLWFTFLAETQFFQPAAARPAEIVDCAALIRYAYREALRVHDSDWATNAHLPLSPGLPSVAKYQYPFTPLAANLFRVNSGPFQSTDLTNGAFAQFADAQTLRSRNTHFVSRDLAHALPGDLLFFRQDHDHMPFHSMIYLGPSQIEPRSSNRYVVYHTGDSEVRRPTVDDLLRFPEPEWRPLPDNPRFLGVYRWNILRKVS